MLIKSRTLFVFVAALVSASSAFGEEGKSANRCAQVIEAESADDFTDPIKGLREGQKVNPNLLKGNESTYELLTKFAELETEYTSSRNFLLGSSPSQLLRLVEYSHFQEFKKENPNSSAIEVYGYETMQAWKRADDYLTSIPVGKFVPSLELFRKIGELSGEAIHPLKVKLSMPGVLPGKGAFKVWPNFARNPLNEPLTEDEYKLIKENRWLEGFVELPAPWSKPGARRGVILYALPGNVENKLVELIAWYKANEGKLDPIRLAVEFQRAFVSIHPFVDGNGRVSRLLMDRILLEYGLPPALLLKHDMDLTAPLDAYEAAVRFGVADSVNLLTYEVSNWDIDLSFGKIGEWSANPKPGYSPFTERFAKIKNFSFSIGDRRFRIGEDGFLYDQYKVPHELHDGRLYPIPDRLVEFYDFGGDLANLSPYRKVSKMRREMFARHVGFVERLEKKRESGVSENIKVVPYETISRLNESGQMAIRPWQEARFIEAMRLREESDRLQLQPFAAGETNYSFRISQNELNPMATVAQYELMDLHLSEFASAVAKYPKLSAAVKAQRQRMHRSARALLAPYLELEKKLTLSDRTALAKLPIYGLFSKYLSVSKLHFDHYDKAINAGVDRYTPLIRSANALSSRVGFIPTGVYTAIARKIPMVRELFSWTDKFLKDLETEAGKKRIAQAVRLSPWIPRDKVKETTEALEEKIPEFKELLGNIEQALLSDPRVIYPMSEVSGRMVYKLEARAIGYDNQSLGLSFSTNAEMYKGGAIHAYGEAKDTAIYVVRVPKDSVRVNYVSEFKGEYEVIGIRPILPAAVIAKYPGTFEMQSAPDAEKNPTANQMHRLLGL
ncbi:MAG TPA: Fic family protein [Bdellovibrionales bacterium]|nr:Fic family protein [Bdellovibrionales bacterium]